MPISGHVQVSYTIQNGALIVGIGPDWVKSIVDVKPGSSLADEARYKDAMNRVGAKNATSVWVDLTAIRTLVEPLIAKNGGGLLKDLRPRGVLDWHATLRRLRSRFDSWRGRL